MSKDSGDKRTKIVCFHLHGGPRVDKFIETESTSVVTRAGEKEGKGSYCLMGTEFPHYFGRGK